MSVRASQPHFALPTAHRSALEHLGVLGERPGVELVDPIDPEVAT